jgi:mercuric transport protein
MQDTDAGNEITLRLRGDRASVRGVVGALFAALAASICCVGPLVLVALGIGGAWASSLRALEPYRPIFIVVTLGLLGFAFYRAYRRSHGPACAPGGSCAVPRVTRVGRTMLWILTPLISALLAFPYFAPQLLQGAKPSGVTAMNTTQTVLKVEGMTCAACVATVRQSLTQVDGVQDAQVTLDPPQAVVSYDPSKTSIHALEQATAKVGYPSSVKQER